METVNKKKEQDSDIIKIDLGRLIKVCLHSAWLIILAAIVCGCISYFWTKKFVTPMYRSSFTAYVNNKANTDSTMVNSSDLDASKSLIDTYSTLLVSEPLMEKAAKKADLALPAAYLSSTISASTVDETEIMQISVTMYDPDQAYEFAKALSKQAPKFVAKIVEGSSMQVIESPHRPTGICYPSYFGNAAKGAMVGFVFAFAAVILRELLDNRVKDVGDLEENFEIPVMGTIPDLTRMGKVHPGTYKKDRKR